MAEEQRNLSSNTIMELPIMSKEKELELAMLYFLRFSGDILDYLSGEVEKTSWERYINEQRVKIQKIKNIISNIEIIALKDKLYNGNDGLNICWLNEFGEKQALKSFKERDKMKNLDTFLNDIKKQLFNQESDIAKRIYENLYGVISNIYAK